VRADGDVNLGDAIEPIGGVARHHVHDPGRGADPANREQAGPAERRIARQLPPGDVKQPAEIAIVRAGAQRAVHHAKVEVVMARVDDDRRSLQRARQGRGGRGVGHDRLNPSLQGPGDPASSRGVAIRRHDLDLGRRGLGQIADDDPPHRSGATEDHDPCRAGHQEGISPRRLR